MKKYIIKLTKEELKTLSIICGKIGGDYNTTRRCHFEDLRAEICKYVKSQYRNKSMIGILHFKKLYISK